LTELFYLLGIPYKEMNTDEELKSYLRRLSDCGPEVVIITSVPVRDDKHKTSVYAYNRNGNRYWKVTCPYLPAHYPGTGDTFTSVIT
ncbi:bifunctional hydroxymethylpyrimidine kinase/phosphomethylpyrimidine kinase, partial [Escherichia coli]|nr:bifunctional hydroxymethylpyrimidine kinase/phosphomethylpyrimidine kinase [Escherichia coli]